jgi:L-aspartate oxidase
MQTDVLIIGCGIAGATTAIELARDSQRQITIITRAEDALDSNSSHAQGGIVTRGEDDSVEQLEEDVLTAGAGLSYPPAVRQLAELGPKYLQELLIDKASLEFDRDEDGKLMMGLEAAHSRRRILHVGDGTGEAIMQGLLRTLQDLPNVTLLTGHTVVDLITFPHHASDPLSVYQALTCHGAYVFNQRSRRVETLLARKTILATGGIGQIFLNTTNPTGARGDGIAMAYRAGASIINAEYVQFHPTALSTSAVTKFLISEAVRGEGGILLTPQGKPFMDKYAPEWKDLAPRDIVARGIYSEMVDKGFPYVLLDIASHQSQEYIRERFPHIYAYCLKQNIDITRQPIPVVPAAHYFCGGVQVDLVGHTNIPNLYAVGEISCTGVHGANRLASTSLLEGLVWGVQSAQDIRLQSPGMLLAERDVPEWNDSNLIYEPDPNLIQADMFSIRNLMWYYVGLVRSEYRLNRAIRDLRQLWLDIEEFYRKTRLSDELIGLRNSVQAALIVAYAAHRNRISRGCHFREDSFSQAKTATPPETINVKLSGGLQ